MHSSSAENPRDYRRSMYRPLSARWPVPLLEPRAVLRHLRTLRRWRMPVTCRRLFAVLWRAPPQLDAVVQVVCHLEIDRAVDHVFERERPRRAIAARI